MVIHLAGVHDLCLCSYCCPKRIKGGNIFFIETQVSDIVAG